MRTESILGTNNIVSKGITRLKRFNPGLPDVAPHALFASIVTTPFMPPVPE